MRKIVLGLIIGGLWAIALGFCYLMFFPPTLLTEIERNSASKAAEHKLDPVSELKVKAATERCGFIQDYSRARACINKSSEEVDLFVEELLRMKKSEESLRTKKR